MSHETQTSSKQEITRKQKLLKRLVPLALLTAGTGMVANEALSNDESNHENVPSRTVHVSETAEFGGAAEGWEHGTADNLIHYLVGKGANEAFEELGQEEIDGNDIVLLAKDLPTFEQANQALEMAENGTSPDEGDELTIGMDVTVDANKTITYVITDASISDKPNNQE